MWHTPVSRVSPENSIPASSSCARAAATSGTRSAMCAPCGLNSSPNCVGIDEIEADATGLELGPALVEVRAVDAQRLAVEPLGPLHVLNRNGDEIRPLHVDHPTEPSICSWIRRFISTAYSSGSSFVIGSTKPDTTIADASASESPRDMR